MGPEERCREGGLVASLMDAFTTKSSPSVTSKPDQHAAQQPHSTNSSLFPNPSSRKQICYRDYTSVTMALWG